MEVFEVIEKRRSIRSYKPSNVPNEDSKRILDAARLAPSAGNREPWRSIVVRTSEQKKASCTGCTQPNVSGGRWSHNRGFGGF